MHFSFKINLCMCATGENYNTFNLSPILPDPLLPTQWSTSPWPGRNGLYFYMAVAQRLEKLLWRVIILHKPYTYRTNCKPDRPAGVSSRDQNILCGPLLLTLPYICNGTCKRSLNLVLCSDELKTYEGI